ncbi:MAG: prenyltransferase [Chloroflexi bacterium]|nr:prenyltransferase [Chloroflexota bacterium]
MTTTAKTSTPPMPLLKRWKMAFDGCNVPDVETTDSVTKWLVISRSCVFSMTITSGLIGVMLAAENFAVNWGLAFLAVIGLIIAHAANNILNDWTDVRTGVDTEDYPRAQYSVHPLLGGLTTPNGLLKAFFILTLTDAALMVYLMSVVGPLVAVFAVSGFVLSVTYTGILKRLGVGELTAMVVWGPLMIAGTAYVAAGQLSSNIWWATLPYGLIVASVLVGKHIDKIEADIGVGIRSVPVLLGEKRAMLLNKATFVIFYLLVITLVALQITGPWILLSFFAIGRLRTTWKMYSEPKPAEPPEDWTVWPLWYVAWAMHFNRKAGEFFILGLLLNILVPKLLNLL